MSLGDTFKMEDACRKIVGDGVSVKRGLVFSHVFDIRSVQQAVWVVVGYRLSLEKSRESDVQKHSPVVSANSIVE